jgi:NADPH:quinone reductase-like Zn-dependent oxidoreductase
VVGDSKRSATAVSTMQAVVQDTYGSADVLRLAQIPQPEIADNEVLVQVRAAGVHIGGGAMGRSMRALVLSPFVSQRLRMVFGQVKSEDLQFLTELIEAGKVAPVIDKAYPLSGVTDAIRDLHSGRARGKFVITM